MTVVYAGGAAGAVVAGAVGFSGLGPTVIVVASVIEYVELSITVSVGAEGDGQTVVYEGTTMVAGFSVVTVQPSLQPVTVKVVGSVTVYVEVPILVVVGSGHTNSVEVMTFVSVSGT